MKHRNRFLALLLTALLALPLLAMAEDTPLLDPNDPYTFTIFADCTWLPYDTFEGGIVQDWMREETGITLDLTKATDSEQINLMIASGDLPDLIMASASAKVSKLSDSDLCWPLQELIDQYIPEWEVPEVEQKLNAYFAQDGNYYMLKNEFNTVDQIRAASNIGPNFGQFHMRGDIYEALGSPALNTKEDFFALMALVKEQYPDMVPLTLNTREYTAVGALDGYDAVKPVDENGNFVMSISAPGFKRMMLTINELYRAGYLTAENFTFTSDEQTFQNLYAGNAFMVTHYAGNDEQKFTARVQEVIPEATVVQVPLMENWNQTIPVSGWAAMFITKDCSDPERAIKMLYWAKQPDNQVSLCNGVPGVDWEYDEDGNIVALQRRIDIVEAGGVDSDYKQIAFLISADDYNTISNGFYASATEATRTIFDDARERANWSNALSLSYPKSGTDVSIKYDDINALTDEYFGKLGTAASEEDFNAIYDEMMEIAKGAGLDEVNEYLTTTYRDVSDMLGAE